MRPEYCWSQPQQKVGKPQEAGNTQQRVQCYKMQPVRTFIKNESQSKCKAADMVELEGDELLNFLLSQPPAEEPQELTLSA